MTTLTEVDRPLAESDPEDGTDDDAVEPGEPEPSDEEGEAEEQDEQPEPASEPVEPPSSETVMRALEKEHGRHEKALRRIMGEGFDGYDDCPVCMSMGYVFGSPLAADETVEACPTCKGFGLLRTPSLVEQHTAKQCMNCLGNGYVTKTPAPVEGIPTSPAVAGAVPLAPAADPEIERLRAQGYTVLPPYVTPTSPTP